MNHKDLSPLEIKVQMLEEQLKKLSFELSEREKELQCQNQITRLLNDSRLSPEKIFQKIVNLLPHAFQFPEKACAHLIIGKEEFISEGFNKSRVSLSKNLESNGKIIGIIEVCYLVKKGEQVKDIFLKEEDDLLNLIAQRIAAFYENNQKELLLTDKEEKFRNLVENLNEVVFEISPAGIINYVSPKVKDTMGFEPEELIGRNFLSFVHKDDLNRIKKIQSNLATRDSKPVEYRFINKKGEARWVRTATRPLFEKGKLIGGSGAMSDITDSKFIEENLKVSEELHRSIFQASPDVITVTDLEGRIISTSPRALTIFGYNKTEDLSGRTLFEFLHPDSREKAKDEIEKMFKGEFRGPDEYLAVKQDGTIFHIEVSGQFIRDEEGNPIQMVFIVRDINQRKELEKELISTKELFRTLVESVNDVIYEVSTEGTINYVSPAIERILGYKPEELTGKNFFQYMFPEDRPALITALKELGNKDFSYLEYRYYAKDGEIRWVRSSTVPIFENGVVVGGRGALTDIHDKKLIELELSKSELQNREIIKNSPVGKVLFDENGVVQLMNKKFTEITGYTIADIDMVDKWFSTVYPDEKYRQNVLDKWNTEVENYLSGNSSFISVEGNIQCKDGSYKWIETSYAKIGELNLVTFIDINAKIISEQMLRQSEESLRNLLNSQTNFVLKTDLEGKHTYWNKKFEEEFGWIYEGKELSGADSLKSICVYHHERVREAVNKCFENPGEIVKVELDKPKKDGSVRTTLWEFICLTDENNNPSEIQCMGIDVTEIKEARDKLKESNRKLNILMNNLKGVAFRCRPDKQWTMEFMSEGITRLTGFNSSDFIENKVRTYDSVIYEEDRKMVWDVINRSLSEKKNYTIEYRILTKDNQIKWVWEKGQGSYENDELIAIEGFISNITDRKNAEMALRLSEENYKN